MILEVSRTEKLAGSVTVPASKSHTIRAIIIASLAEGTSVIDNPLSSGDTTAAVNACTALGAKFNQDGSRLVVEGFGRRPQQPDRALDMLNSGTSTNLMMGIVAGLGLRAAFTGDASLRSRPVGPLARSLQALGCRIAYEEKDGLLPLTLQGPLEGRSASIDAGKSSQYVSSLLLACPLAGHDITIDVHNPTELPYIDMTLRWMDEQGIRYERSGYGRFTLFGGQSYRPFRKRIPADWSSAAFPLSAAAVTGSEITLHGVDTADVQGDKKIVSYLENMGASFSAGDGSLTVSCRSGLTGQDIDINDTPDALPALSVIGCCAAGTTRLHNVAQARVKETDRIRVMALELSKMGAAVRELPDGLLIRSSRLCGASLNGHHDHRVVMALAVAGLAAEGRTTVDTAQAVSVTYPEFVASMQALGAHFKTHTEETAHAG